jgi:hypothetical protein
MSEIKFHTHTEPQASMTLNKFPDRELETESCSEPVRLVESRSVSFHCYTYIHLYL